MRDESDLDLRARIPADVDAPDKIAFGLTARQLAILAVAAAPGYLLVTTVGDQLPLMLLLGVLAALAAGAFTLAVGRRDGLPMDAWLLAALQHARRPKRRVSAQQGAVVPPPSWAPPAEDTTTPAVLRLPADAISDNGVISTSQHNVALVACTTVNINLRTGAEQAALLAAYGRWLNSLTEPVQIVISTQRVDLSRHANRVAAAAATLTDEALAGAAADYADFLDELAAVRDPLWRTVTIAVTSRDSDLSRRARHTAAALATLGIQSAVLDGPRAAAVLTAAVDPYGPADGSWARSLPDTVITGGKR